MPEARSTALFRPGVRERWLTEATPLLLCRVALWAFVCLLVTRTAADADLWGHLRFGLDMLASKSLPAVDTYSFTSDRPWVNHEWLAELLTAAAYRALGSPGLVLLKLGVIGVIAAILFAVAREERADPLARDLFVAVTLFVTYTRTQVVRPQLFSVALFCAVLYLLRQDERGRRWALWGVPLCFALWVNLHGGWIVGLGAVGVWMAADAWQHRSVRRIGTLALAGTLTLLATLANPYGTGLWAFVAETVRFERPDITDWRPLFQLPLAVILIDALLPALALTALWRQRLFGRVAPRDAAVVALLALATVRLGRVDAFLQAAMAILLAPQLIPFLNGLRPRVPRLLLRPSIAVGAITVGLAAYASAAALQNARAVHVQGRWLPDRTAAMFLRDRLPGSRVLTWFDWGEYAIWQLSPAGILVSMDGRRETVYSRQVLRDHNRFYAADPAMADYPDRIGADHVWLPSNFRILEPLRERGWKTVLDTGRSVVLSRDGLPAHLDPVRPAAPEPGVFPWP